MEGINPKGLRRPFPRTGKLLCLLMSASHPGNGGGYFAFPSFFFARSLRIPPGLTLRTPLIIGLRACENNCIRSLPSQRKANILKRVCIYDGIIGESGKLGQLLRALSGGPSPCRRRLNGAPGSKRGRFKGIKSRHCRRMIRLDACLRRLSSLVTCIDAIPPPPPRLSEWFWDFEAPKWKFSVWHSTAIRICLISTVAKKYDGFK